MAPMKKYGRAKAKVSSTAASAIFGVASPSREPLDDITVALENLKVDGSSICPDRPTTPRSLSESPIHSPESKQPSSLSNITVSNPDDATSSSQSSLPNQESLSEVLKPLLESYEADCHDSIEELPWSDLLPSSATVAKIAEASFAEVFRVTSSIGETSILKIMPLRVPSDPGSLEMDTAIQIEDVVSEVRIMNALTTLPGFVIFKAAYIVQGKPSIDFIEAHNKHSDSRGGSYFPDPDTYTSSSVFLVIELDDAGDALDDIDIDSVDAIWDILLGVIIAVSKAETAYEFEHRDMHENNICIFYKEPQVLNLPEEVKYGRSGYQVTILDYGLSRATLESGEYIYNNLENDLMLFRSIGDSVAKHQFDAYRRMRTHLFTGGRTMYPKSWHTNDSVDLNNGHTWAEFIPFTNVLWIHYLYIVLRDKYERLMGLTDELKRFLVETEELYKKLMPRTRANKGGFECASQITEYAFNRGWITQVQLGMLGDTGPGYSDMSSACLDQ